MSYSNPSRKHSEAVHLREDYELFISILLYNLIGKSYLPNIDIFSLKND